MAKDKETLQFHFYVIACFGKKNQPFKGDPAGRFVGYWSDCSPLKDIYAVRKYPTKAAAKTACKELNSDDYYWYTGKVRKYTATIEETKQCRKR